jgi:CO/xanthine dehydrogenase Mo-binding subunit
MKINRRDFIIAGTAAGSAFALGIMVPAIRSRSRGPKTTFAPNVWLRIDGDGKVTIVAPRSEMGQGIMTALPMVVADELDADWSDVVVEQAVIDSKYGRQSTGGSDTVSSTWEAMRQAGAVARSMLVAAAALELGVGHDSLRTRDGFVLHDPTLRKLSYGTLAARASTLPIPRRVTLKTSGDFRLIGTSIPRVDSPSKVDGSARYGIDVRLPGMLFASIERAPSIDGRLVRFDAGKSLKVPGVRYVHEVQPVGEPVNDISGVAVVADNSWSAFEGRRVLDVTWDAGSHPTLTTEQIEAEQRARSREAGHAYRLVGDAAADLARASRLVEAEYVLPYLAHATMEPMNITVHAHDGRIDVWAPTQYGSSIQRRLSRVHHVPLDCVTVNVTMMGGGFGRRYHQDTDMHEAVELSRILGCPIQVVWSRQDDMRHDYYRPKSLHVLRAALGTDGMPTSWFHRMVAGSVSAQWEIPNAEDIEDRHLVPLYAIPNQRYENVIVPSPVPLGAWRSVSNSQCAFVNESFIDELASEAKIDAVDYRLRLLRPDYVVPDTGDPPWRAGRLRDVVEMAAQRASWGSPLPPGHARGIACAQANSSYVAQIAEVSMEGAAVRVHRVVAVNDCGQTVNPNTIEAQMQGGIVFGLSAALYGEIHVDQGRIREGNFDDQPVVRMPEAPRVEVTIMRSSEHPSGVGEPPVPPIAPAVANAVFALTGKRIRRLPLTIH